MRSYAEAMRANHTAFYNQAMVSGASNGILVDLHPLSRGTINIDPDDPEGTEPLVDYRALSNPLDAVVMADILRYTRSFYLNNSINAQYDPVEVQPGAEVQTDEEMAAFLAETLSPSEFHPSGTAAMLPKDLGGVVDQELKVYGVERLRVVDASIIPTLVGANTCQTVYAIGEKVSAEPNPEHIYHLLTGMRNVGSRPHQRSRGFPKAQVQEVRPLNSDAVQDSFQHTTM